QRDVQRGQRRGCVFGRLSNLIPSVLFSQTGGDADRFFSSLSLAEPRGDPPIGDAEQLAHTLRCRDGLGNCFAERIARGAQMRLALQVAEQAMPESLEQSKQSGPVDLLTQPA